MQHSRPWVYYNSLLVDRVQRVTLK